MDGIVERFLERIMRSYKIIYSCAGGLLIYNCVPIFYPSLMKKKSESNEKPPEELVSHVRKIAKAMNLRNYENLDVFITKDTIGTSLGSTLLPNGAAVGLSKSVLYRSEEDVKKIGYTLANKPVEDWTSPEGRALLRVLIPSADIINFSIAHEIAHLKKHHVWWETVFMPVFFVLGYHVAVFVSKHYFAHMMRVGFPVLMGMAYVAYTPFNALIQERLNFRADRVAAMCCKSYAEGGLETLRGYLQMEQLNNDASPKSWLHRLNDSLEAGPEYKKRLDRLEEVSRLYR